MNYLFVCGTARSGTTAFAELLNTHPKIVVGIERYKRVLIGNPDQPFELQDLFSYDRFFNWSESETNVRVNEGQYKELYERARAKFEQAELIGDKIPGLYRRIPWLLNQVPDAKIIYMLRSPLAVAKSWDVRAKRQERSWPATNDFFAAVPEWNRSIRLARKHKRAYGEKLAIVFYDDIFGARAWQTLETLQKWLGVSPFSDPATAEFLKASQTFPAARESETDNPEWSAYIQNNADFDGFKRLLSHRLA
jgi:hypothetical protein